MQKDTIKKVVLSVLIIINCITIFYFSSQVAENSSAQSGRVVNFIAQILPSIKNMQEPQKTIFIEGTLTTIVRKTAHLSIYTLLGILTMNYMITSLKGRGFYQRGLSALLFCILYASTDEIHQYFVPGRSCELRDVCIDTLGAIIGIILVTIVTKLYRKINKKEENYKIDKNTKILFISSTGGHFAELMKLKPLMEKCNYSIVTEKTKTNSKLKEQYKEKINFLIYGTRKEMYIYPLVLLINSFISLGIFIKNRPQVVITTGTHTAGPMCMIAKILGSRVIYIETFANRKTKTATGKILYYIADTFVVQWEEMKKLYPKAECWGWLF